MTRGSLLEDTKRVRGRILGHQRTGIAVALSYDLKLAMVKIIEGQKWHSDSQVAIS